MDSRLLLLILIPFIIGVFYIISKTVENKKVLNGIWGIIGTLLFICLALWSFYIKTPEDKVVLLGFIILTGSMGTVAVVNLLLDKQTKLPIWDILLLLSYLPIFFLLGQSGESILSSAISIGFFYITIGLLETFRPLVELKHLAFLKIVLWLVFLIIGIVFRNTITI